MNTFADDMAQFDEELQDVVPTDGRLPDGNHRVLLTESLMTYDNDKETWTWEMKFRNKSGGIRKWNNLDRDKSREFAMMDAKRLGYEGPFSGLKDWLDSGESLDLICGIKVETKPGDERDFTNVYINQVLGKGTLEDVGASVQQEPAVAAGSLAEDDIPF